MEADERKKREWPTDGDRLLSTEEVAYRMKTNKGFVGLLYSYGLLKFLRMGKNKRVRLFTLNAFLEEHEGEDIYQIVEDLEKERTAAIKGA